jgi:translation initiation factor 2B subunit (eIF-2B alpha/beta/delta family)
VKIKIDWNTIGQQAAGAATGFLTGNLVLAGLDALGRLFGRRRRKQPKQMEPSFSITTIMKGDQPSLTAYDLTQSIFNALQNNASTSPNTQLRNAMMIQGTQSYMQAVPQIKQATAQIEAQKAQSLMETYARGLQAFASKSLEEKRMELEKRRLKEQQKMTNLQMLIPFMMSFINNNNQSK